MGGPVKNSQVCVCQDARGDHEANRYHATDLPILLYSNHGIAPFSIAREESPCSSLESLGRYSNGARHWVKSCCRQLIQKQETTVKPLEEPTELITTGAFRVSRHPMYLGFVTVLLGIAVLMGSLKPYAGVFVFAIFMDVILIRFEEKKLEDTFGEAWFEYKKKVRRWI